MGNSQMTSRDGKTKQGQLVDRWGIAETWLWEEDFVTLTHKPPTGDVTVYFLWALIFAAMNCKILAKQFYVKEDQWEICGMRFVCP